MQKSFFQLICPFWSAFESCAKVLVTDAPAIMKFDAMMSRTIHALNRPRFAKDGQKSYSFDGCADERIEPEYCPPGKTESRNAAGGPQGQA